MNIDKNIPKLVLKSCNKLIDHNKYSWLKFNIAPNGAAIYDREIGPFKGPEDPSEDIKEVLKWSSVVGKISKGCDYGHDFYADRFRELGSKAYQTNINLMLSRSRSHHIFLTTEELLLYEKRWSSLIEACYECTNMMRLLTYNWS